jgi:hypothetical protein
MFIKKMVFWQLYFSTRKIFKSKETLHNAAIVSVDCGQVLKQLVVFFGEILYCDYDATLLQVIFHWFYKNGLVIKQNKTTLSVR